LYFLMKKLIFFRRLEMAYTKSTIAKTILDIFA